MWLWRHFSKSQMPSEHLLGWGSLGFLDPRIPVFQQIICIFSVIFIYGTPLQYSCLENPMDGGAWWAAVHGVAGVGDNWGTSLSLFTFMQWRRKWQPTPVFLPGETQGRGGPVGCRLWGCTESDTTEVIQQQLVQSLGCVQLFVTPWIAARQASLSITNSCSSLKLTSIESVMPSSHLILCHPLFFQPPIPPSIRVFSNESNLRMRWPKYWSFSFSIIPSKEIPGLLSFRMDWLDLFAVHGTLKSLLQHHSSKASILRRSAFFTVQLSHPYMTTEKTIAL